MKDDEELEMLLGEIPHATSAFHVNGTNVVSPPLDRMMMYDDDDDESLCGYSQNASMFSYGNLLYDIPSSSSSSQLAFSSLHDPVPRAYLELSESPFRKEVDEDLMNEISRMFISEEQNEGLFCGNQLNSGRFADCAYFEPNPRFSRIPQSNLDRNMLSYCYQWGIPAHIGMNAMNQRGLSFEVGSQMQNVPCMTRSNVRRNMNHDPHRFHVAVSGSSNFRNTRGEFGIGLDGLANNEDSLIIQGEDLSRVKKMFESPCESGRTKVKISCSSQLREAQRYVYVMAKDQHGCRLLQKIFDDGNPQHVQIVFNEIIGHVVELMINPFGNYLMQKLLEVCNEEQRMHILMKVTHEPRELVHISLNTHGTRVVQKLIETIKTRVQVKLVISALKPGFLSLTKDLNGNHVIQRCLQCLSYEDNKFIFEAAAKYCVDIATHQHGCCVLQRCINHSTGDHREKIVSEVSANAVPLAQDPFGNYVVQYIIEMQIPSAVSKLTLEFEGNYVQLATQKFSSHVVEKCLAVLDSQVRSTIIRELMSATHFEQLIQDPHANYVIQTALRVAEMACIAPRLHGEDAGGDPPDDQRPMMLPHQCEGLGKRGESKHKALKKAFKQNGYSKLEIVFEAKDQKAFKPVGRYGANFSSYVGELIKEIP
ncbi:putative pumilio homolog 8, chloroplastic [Tanacetum coccineum]